MATNTISARSKALSSAGLLLGFFSLGVGQDSGPLPDTRQQREVKTGPYSTANTAYGTLATAIPLVGLKCRGEISLDFSVRHRMNRVNQSGINTWGLVASEPGKGWTTNLDTAVFTTVDGDGASVIAQTQYGDIAETWGYQVNGSTGALINITRKAGTRNYVQELRTGTVRTGFLVTDQKTKTKYYYQYDISGVNQQFRLSSVVDTFGNTLTLTYDTTNKRVTKLTEPGGRYLDIFYNAGLNGQIDYVRLTAGSATRTWDFEQDASNWLGWIHHPNPTTGGSGGPYLSLHYDAYGNIDDLWDLKQKRHHYVYTKNVGWGLNTLCLTGYHRPTPTGTNTWDTNGTYFSWATQGTGQSELACTIQEPFGSAGSPTYKSRKHVYYNVRSAGETLWPIKRVEDTPVAVDSNAVYSESYVWDRTQANLTSRVDRRGKTWTYEYLGDNSGLLTRIYDPINTTVRPTKFFYQNDLVVTKVDPKNDRTRYIYDGTTFALLQTIVDPASDPIDGYTKSGAVALTTTNTYDSQGNPASTKVGTDTATTFSNYDVYGNARTVTDALSNSTTFLFDTLNNKTSETRPSPQGTTTYTYDGWNRPLRTTYPGGAYNENSYDDNNNVTQVRDELGHLINSVYDNRNRPTSTTEQTGSSTNVVTSYTYDASDRKATTVNGRSKTTSYGYDERHNLRLITYPDATTRQFHFDGNGNRNQRIDGRGRTTNYTFDDLNRLTQAYHVFDASSFNYTYNYDGMRATMTDPSSGTAQTWTYNGAKQLTSHYQPVPNKTLTYTYDTGGRRKTMVLGSQTWTYNYDGAYRLQNMTQTVGAATVASYTYNADSSLNTRTHGSGFKTVYGYDLRGRTTSVSHQNSSGTEQQRLNYTYDDASNVATYTDIVSGGTVWSSTYGYDWADRLTSETRSGSYGSLNTSYAYDGNGNRSTVTRGGTPSTYTVDDNDRLTSGDGYTLSSYDGDGNPGSVFNSANGVTMTLSWDTESKLTQIAYSSGGSDTFKYNGDGLRVEKVDNTGTYRHVYDGTTVVADTNSSGTILNYHVPGVGVIAGTTQGYFRENGLGSSVATTGSTGTVDSRTEYDAFGMEYVAMSGPRTNFRFAGKHGYYSDDRSGLDLLGQRYYIPKLGRFLNQDPIGQEGGLNLYAYCDNNPLRAVDPDGRSPLFPVSFMPVVKRMLYNYCQELLSQSYPKMEDAGIAGAWVASINTFFATDMQAKTSREFGGWIVKDQGQFWIFNFRAGGGSYMPGEESYPDNAYAKFHSHPIAGLPIIDGPYGGQGKVSGTPHKASEGDKKAMFRAAEHYNWAFACFIGHPRGVIYRNSNMPWDAEDIFVLGPKIEKPKPKKADN